MNNWPDNFPCPQIEGWSESIDLGITATMPSVLPPQIRRLYDSLPALVDMEFVVTQADLAAVQPWMNSFGYTWFSLPLPGWHAGVASVVARFVGDMSLEFFLSGRASPYWRIKVQAEMYRSELGVDPTPPPDPEPPAFRTMFYDWGNTSDAILVENYFDGGLDDDGNGPGPAYEYRHNSGYSVSAWGYLNGCNSPCFVGAGLLNEGGSSGLPHVLNSDVDFTGMVSLFYAAGGAITVTVYSGVDGGGTVLSSQSFLTTGTSSYEDMAYAFWKRAVVMFAGVGRSIRIQAPLGGVLIDAVHMGVEAPPAPTPHILGAICQNVTFNTDGTISYTPYVPHSGAWNGPGMYLSYQKVDAGHDYFVRATLLAGTLSSGVVGSWLPLTSAQAWALNAGAVIQFQLATDAAGATIVGSTHSIANTGGQLHHFRRI